MDVVRQNKKSPKKHWLYTGLVAAAVALAGVYGLTTTEGGQYRMEKNRLRVGTVQQGSFDIVVRAAGEFAPTDIRWQAAQVNGRVEQVLVKPGAVVTAGHTIAKLSNPKLVQRLNELEWDLEALEAEQLSDLRRLESSELAQRATELEIKSEYQNALMTYKAQSALREQGKGSVSEIDYESIRVRTETLKQRLAIEKAKSKNSLQNVSALKAANKARLSKLKKQILQAQQNVEDLTITASINAVIQDVAIEPGQQLVEGSNIAKLVRANSLVAQLQIPEMQISLVALNQPAVIDTRTSTLSGLVSRIAPSVINGTVEVDIELSEPLPLEARPELSIEGEVLVSSIQDAVYVERPAYSQTNQTLQIFKLSADGATARKIPVTFGKGSASKIEVLQGLAAGDKIIVSDQNEFQSFSSISIH